MPGLVHKAIAERDRAAILVRELSVVVHPSSEMCAFMHGNTSPVSLRSSVFRFDITVRIVFL
jgi:hypothetical protein